MKLNGVRKVFLGAAVFVLVVLFLFEQKRDSLAHFLFERYQLVTIPLVLAEHDADIPFTIGNYYFGNTISADAPDEGHYNIAAAERAFEKMLDINPEALWGHYQLARIHFVRGDFSRALDEIVQELRHHPQNLRSLYVRGLIYAYRAEDGDTERAERDFAQFVLWAPSEWAGYNDLAWILGRQEKYEEAHRVLSRGLVEASGALENPWMWNNLGTIKLNLKRYDEALESFKRANELASTLTEHTWQRAYPGNSPSSNSERISEFKESILRNIKRAELHTDN